MDDNFLKIINEEVQKLKGLFSILINEGGYKQKESSIEQIIFSNTKGYELIFIYDVNRYTVGKHMSLSEINVGIENKIYTLEQLMALKEPNFDLKEYYDSKRKQGVSRKLASLNLLNNHLLETLI